MDKEVLKENDLIGSGVIPLAYVIKQDIADWF
jgi:hypothetical protein